MGVSPGGTKPPPKTPLAWQVFCRLGSNFWDWIIEGWIVREIYKMYLTDTRRHYLTKMPSISATSSLIQWFTIFIHWIHSWAGHTSHANPHVEWPCLGSRSWKGVADYLLLPIFLCPNTWELKRWKLLCSRWSRTSKSWSKYSKWDFDDQYISDSGRCLALHFSLLAVVVSIYQYYCYSLSPLFISAGCCCCCCCYDTYKIMNI